MLEQLSFFGQESMDLEKKKQEEKKKETIKKSGNIKKTKVAKEVKETPSKSKKSTAGKKKTENQFTLPLVVHGGIYTYTIDGDGEISKGNVKKCMCEQFPELEGAVDIKKEEDQCILVTKFNAIKVKEQGDQKIKAIKYGNLIKKTVIDTSLKDAWKQFLLEHQEFYGCQCHLTKSNIVVPFFDKTAECKQMYQTPVRIGFCNIDQMEEISFDQEFVSERELLDEYSKKYPEFKQGSFLDFERYNFLMPIAKKSDVSDKTKLKLPITVKTGAYDVAFDTDDFEEEFVTKEQVRQALEKIYPEYSKERTEMLFDDRYFLVAVLKSSKKGYSIIPHEDSDIEVIDNEKSYIEKHLYGTYYLSKENDVIDFELDKPIPRELLLDIIDLFKEDPTKEKAAQIFWNGKEYELYVPEQVVTESSVEFKRNKQLETKKDLVMDIHSHACYPAFFSVVDNDDEKGTRLYMVIGNLDKDRHSIAARVGIKGIFRELDPFYFFGNADEFYVEFV